VLAALEARRHALPMCVYRCMCVNVYMCVYMYMYICIFVCIYRCLQHSKPVAMPYLCVYIDVCVHRYICVCTYLCIYLYRCMCVQMYMCVHMYVFIYRCVRHSRPIAMPYLCVEIDVCSYVCICVYMYVCLCAYMCSQQSESLTYILIHLYTHNIYPHRCSLYTHTGAD